jgi:vitamin B12 transporter
MSSSPRLHGPRRNRGKKVCMVCFLVLALWMPSIAWPRQEEVRRITGQAVDQSGAPVPRVLVEVRAPSGRLNTSVLTDSGGRFVIELPDGTYELDATAPGLAPVRRQLLDVSPSSAPINITLAIPSIQQEIVVTATRTDVPHSQVGSSTTIVRGSELEGEGIHSMADALRRVPGLTISQSGGTGQLTSLFTRGGESDYTKVLIDGVPVNDPGGSFNFANLSIAGVDRIEIVRGPQSALFGSDAMAGVIQIFTRQGRSEGLEPRPFVALAGGSLATFGYEAGIEGKGNRLDYAASFARLDTDNDVQNGSFNRTAVSGNLGFTISKASQLRAIFRSDAGRAGVPGQWAFHPPDADEFYRHRNLAGGMAFSHATTPTWTQMLSYSVSDSRQYSEDSVDSGRFVAAYQGRTSGFTSYDFPYQTLNQSRRQKLDYHFELCLPNAHLLTAGAEYEHEAGTVGDPRNQPLVAVRNNYAGFVQDQWFLRKRLFLAAGARFEHNESFGFSATPRLSLAWHAHQGTQGGLLGLTKIKANFGLGIKEPTLVESFSKSPYFLGNPNLRPEKSTSFDIGMEQSFADSRGALEIAFFQNRYRDQIGFVTTDFTTFAGTYFNLGRSRAQGIETTFRQNLGGNVECWGTYLFLDSLVLENTAPLDPVFAPGQALFRRPRHSGSLDLRWRPGRWTFGATATVVGSRLDSDFLGLDLTQNPGYGSLDLLVSIRLFSGITVFAVVNNALDRDYMEAFGYPALPVRFRLGLSTGRRP